MVLRLVLATANPHKAAEIRALLGTVPGLELLPRPPEVAEVDETGADLLANARLKARALAAATGQAAVADDTGLEVAALGGAPGVRSARWAGEGASYADNVAKLLEAMAGVADRRARFRTVAVVAWPDGREVVAEGAVDGVIVAEPRGQAGFGYDPVFAPEGGGGRTFGQTAAGEKQSLSHRGEAFRALAEALVHHQPLTPG